MSDRIICKIKITSGGGVSLTMDSQDAKDMFMILGGIGQCLVDMAGAAGVSLTEDTKSKKEIVN